MDDVSILIVTKRHKNRHHFHFHQKLTFRCHFKSNFSFERIMERCHYYIASYHSIEYDLFIITNRYFLQAITITIDVMATGVFKIPGRQIF